MAYASASDAEEDDVRFPVTHSEMQALLEPLRSCLQRMESTMQEMSRSLPVAQDGLQNDRDRYQLGHFKNGSFVKTPRQPASSRSPRGPSPRIQTSSAKPSVKPTVPKRATKTSNNDQKMIALVPMDAESVDHSKAYTGISTSVIDVPSNEREVRKPHIVKSFDICAVLDEKSFTEGLTSVEKKLAKLKHLFSWLDRCWETLEEPTRNTCAYRIAASGSFEVVSLVIIVFNSVLVAYIADWRIQHIGDADPVAFDVLEKVCVAWFVVELAIRLLAHRLHFFVNHDLHWNIFDFTLVTISVVNLGLDHFATSEGGNVGFMRMLRLLKLAKIFRSLRSFRFVKSLEILLESFRRSFISLFWGFVMLAFIIYLFALVFLQATIDYVSTEDRNPEVTSEALDRFGSLGGTLLSLYMAVTGGDEWRNLYKIIYHTGWVYSGVLVLFTFFFLFALFNILTAMLVEKALTTSKPERTEMILQQRKQIAEQKQTFLQVCHSMDQDGDGNISFEEFQEWICNPVMLSYMASIGIEIYDVELFFQTVGARSERCGNSLRPGEVTINHFVEGMMHMKGSATALDMQRQLFEMHLLHHDLKDFHLFLHDRLQDMEQMLSERLESFSFSERPCSERALVSPTAGCVVSL